MIIIWLQSMIVKNDGICDGSQAVNEDLVGVQDAIIKPLIVEAEGAERSYSNSEYICRDSQGNSFITSNTDMRCMRTSVVGITCRLTLRRSHSPKPELIMLFSLLNR